MKKLIVILMIVLFPLIAVAQDKYLVWDANTESDLAGYRVWHHPIGVPENSTIIDVGNVTEKRWSEMVTIEGNIFWLTAYDTSGNESDPSKKIDDLKPAPPGGCRWVNK